jgi:hypothetical protein
MVPGKEDDADTPFGAMLFENRRDVGEIGLSVHHSAATALGCTRRTFESFTGSLEFQGIRQGRAARTAFLNQNTTSLEEAGVCRVCCRIIKFLCGVSRHRSSIHVLVLPYRESIHVVFAQKSPATDFGNYEFRYSETDIRFGFTFAVVWYSFTALYYPQHVYLSSSRFGPESLPRGRCIWKSATLCCSHVCLYFTHFFDFLVVGQPSSIASFNGRKSSGISGACRFPRRTED